MCTFISEHNVTIVHVPGKSKMHNLADDLSRATNLMSPLPSCESSEKGKGAMVKERHYYGEISEKFDNAVNYLAEPSAIDAQEDDEYDEEDAVRLFAQQGNIEVMLKELEVKIPLEVILIFKTFTMISEVIWVWIKPLTLISSNLEL